MMRVVLGSALPLLGVGLAAVFVAPSLLGTPSGEPMLVAAPGSASFRPASFDAAACPEPLLLAERAARSQPGLRVVALGFLAGPDGVKVVMQDVPSGVTVPDQTMLLVLDAAGRVVATGAAAALAEGSPIEARNPDCGSAPQAPAGNV